MASVVTASETTTRTATPPSRRSSPANTTPGSRNSATPTTSDACRSLWRFSRAFTIGRSRRSDAIIPTTAKTRTVSKLHVRVFPVRDSQALSSPTPTDPHAMMVYVKPTRWVLQDLEAMNGTSLNGVDVPPGGSVELHDGDELVLASTMRHGARVMIQILHDDCSTISVKLEDSDTVASPTEQMTAERISASPVAARLESPEFRTPPPTRASTRYTSSTVATKRERHHRDSSERRHEHADGNEPMEDVGEVVQQRKRSRRLEELDDQDRCMMCPICFEYFHSSVTLPCSHTFCGLCVSSWFRSSLSCPQCRTDVTSLPVHNRALDDLVHRLAGETEGYKSLIAKRMKIQVEYQRQPQREPQSRSPAGFHMPTNLRNPFLSDSPRTSRAASTTISSATATRTVIPVDDNSPLPNVFTRWKQEEIARVRAILAKQFGETRLQTCRRLGLTEASMKQASTSQTAIAMQNLLLDWWPYERVRDEGDQRLKIFLHFG